MIVPLLARVPLRHLLPLSLVVWAAVAALISALAQMHSYDGAVESDMRRSMGERLNLEQQRIEVQHALGNRLQVRRIVAGLGLLTEVSHAWLTDRDGRVIASLRRAELGKPFAAVLEPEPAALRAALLDAASRDARKVQFLRPEGAEFMVGHAAVGSELRLLLSIDLARPLVERLYASRGELWIEGGVIIAFAALLAAALHRLWFRRMGRMTEALRAIGNGRLDTRIALEGRDELAQLAAAIDQMAAQLQDRQTNLQQLSTILAHSPVIAMEWENSPGWPMNFVSESVGQWGYDRRELLSGELDFASLIHPEDKARIVAEVAAYLVDGPDEYRQEYRLRTADGRWIWVDDRTWLARGGDGRVTTISGVLLDISQQKQTEDALQASEDALRRINAGLEARVAERTAQLQVLNEELESFSYSVSHDLKAPLRGIDGYSQILLDDYGSALDDEGRTLIANVRRGVAQMHVLIEDLLAYSRMERQVLESRAVELAGLVDNLLAGRAREIAAAGMVVHNSVPALSVQADRDGLALVVRNLLENALKFSRNSKPPRIDIGAREEADKVLFWVRDNGVGFDMKYHHRVFEMFQRLHRAEDYPGTGVGLALVRKAMQRMGGRVWAESSPGQGACFFLELRK